MVSQSSFRLTICAHLFPTFYRTFGKFATESKFCMWKSVRKSFWGVFVVVWLHGFIICKKDM